MSAAKDKLDEVLAKAFDGVTGALDKLSLTFTSFTSISSPVKAAGSAASAAGLPEVGAALDKVSGALEQFFQVIQRLVQVANPAVIELFNNALNNVQATIGQVFIPVFTDLTQVFQRAAGLIAPAMEQLAPIVKQLADVFGNFLLRYLVIVADYFKQYVGYLSALIHVFEPLIEIILLIINISTTYARLLLFVVEIFLKFSGITVVLDIITIALRAFNEVFRIVNEVMNIFAVVLEVAAKVVEDFFAEILPTKNILSELHKVVNQVIKALYVFAVQMAKMFGLNDTAAAIIKSLDAKANATGTTAAQSTSIKSFEQLAKDIATKAAGAGAGGDGGIEDERAFWKETLAAARAAEANSISFQEIVKQGFKDVVNALPKPPGVETAVKAGSYIVEKAEKNKYAIAGGAVAGPLGALAGSLFD
jgi:hypothetical protein